MQAIEEFLQDIKDYFYRTLIDPMYIYREILPQSVIEAGFKNNNKLFLIFLIT